MKYSADLGRLGIEEYKQILKNQKLLPARKALQQDLDLNFSLLTQAGIKNVSELNKAVSTAVKLKNFSGQTGISEPYLVLLKREAGSLEPKPVQLTQFPGIDLVMTSSLLNSGIKSSRDFFELFSAKDDYKSVLKELALQETEAYELFCLCSLVRINGIGAAAAKCFLEAGFSSVSDIAKARAEDMLIRVAQVNEEKQYYKAKLGAKDMQFCIDYAIILDRLGN